MSRNANTRFHTQPSIQPSTFPVHHRSTTTCSPCKHQSQPQSSSSTHPYLAHRCINLHRHTSALHIQQISCASWHHNCLCQHPHPTQPPQRNTTGYLSYSYIQYRPTYILHGSAELNIDQNSLTAPIPQNHSELRQPAQQLFRVQLIHQRPGPTATSDINDLQGNQQASTGPDERYSPMRRVASQYEASASQYPMQSLPTPSDGSLYEEVGSLL